MMDVRDLDLDLDMVTGVWYTHVLNFDSLPSSCFLFGQWSLIYLCSKFCLYILILKVQRTSMSFKSYFGALEDAGGS